jgi:hypothetical protein
LTWQLAPGQRQGNIAAQKHGHSEERNDAESRTECSAFSDGHNAIHALIFFRYNVFMSDVTTIRLTETVKAAG